MTYDIEVLRQQSDYIRLTPTQKTQCEECYRYLTPYRTISVLATGDNKKRIGAYNFINDAGKISEAIVIILYMLRCCLAHGDISPDESANEVYKYAYPFECNLSTFAINQHKNGNKHVGIVALTYLGKRRNNASESSSKGSFGRGFVFDKKGNFRSSNEFAMTTSWLLLKSG